MGSSLNGTGLTFSSGATLNAVPVTSYVGQTGAVDPTTIGAIGCFMPVFVLSTSQYAANTTIAGSSLFYGSGSANYQNNPVFNLVNTSQFYLSYSAVQTTGATEAYPSVCRVSAGNRGNLGVVLPFGCTALTGTWRLLTLTRAGSTSYDGTYNTYSAEWSGAFAVRIS